jgi:hypothetical protein
MTLLVKESENGKLVRFKEDRSLVRVNWSNCDKTAILLGVSRATVSSATSAFTNRRKTTSAKSNRGRKSTLIERDGRTLRRIV